MLAQEQSRDSAEVPGERQDDVVRGRMVNGTTGNSGLGPSGAAGSMSLENPNLLDTVQLGDRPERGFVVPKASSPPDPSRAAVRNTGFERARFYDERWRYRSSVCGTAEATIAYQLKGESARVFH